MKDDGEQGRKRAEAKRLRGGLRFAIQRAHRARAKKAPEAAVGG